MSNKLTLLLISRILNVTGDWFYYFVITLLVFKLNPRPITLSLLTVSYIFPGIIFPKVIIHFNNKNDMNTMLAVYDVFRSILILLMMYFNDVWIILLLVFCEQVFSIGSYMTFENIVASLPVKTIAPFNGSLSAWSNVTKIFVTLLFMVQSGHLNYHYLLFINFLLTICSVILTRLSGINCFFNLENFEHDARNKCIACKTTNIILTFSIISLIRVFYDTYTLLFLKYINADEQFGYSLTFFVIGLSTIVSSIFSKKIIPVTIKYIKQITLLTLFLNIFSLFTLTLITSNLTFYIVVFVTTYVITFYELYMLYHIQLTYDIGSQIVYSKQISIYNLLALTFTFVSSSIITMFNVLLYVYVLVGVCFIVLFYLFIRGWEY